MTPRLVPHSLLRFGIPALTSAAAGLFGWWAAMLLAEWWRGSLGAAGEGRLLLLSVALCTALVQPALQGRYAGAGWRSWLGASALVSFVVLLPGWLGMWMVDAVVSLFVGLDWLPAQDPVSMALGPRALSWLMAGLVSAGAAWTWRAGRMGLESLRVRWQLETVPPALPLDGGFWGQTALHLVAGVGAGLAGASVWYGVGLVDRFVGTAMGAWAFGLVQGAVLWSVPASHFVAWVRVHQGPSPGWRFPLDPDNPARSERFVGSFPRGLDLAVPGALGVEPLHVSFVAKEHGAWAVRGLAVAPVRVTRLLEQVDLAYDPTKPAPLETAVRSGDVVRVGEHLRLELVVTTREGQP